MNLNAKATRVGIAAAVAAAAAMTAAGIAFASVGGPATASTPLQTGRTAVQLTSEDLSTSSSTPSATSTDDWGNHSGSEAGDDHGTHAEPGDDHGRHAESGDDHGRGGHGSDG